MTDDRLSRYQKAIDEKRGMPGPAMTDAELIAKKRAEYTKGTLVPALLDLLDNHLPRNMKSHQAHFQRADAADVAAAKAMKLLRKGVGE